MESGHDTDKLMWLSMSSLSTHQTLKVNSMINIGIKILLHHPFHDLNSIQQQNNIQASWPELYTLCCASNHTHSKDTLCCWAEESQEQPDEVNKEEVELAVVETTAKYLHVSILIWHFQTCQTLESDQSTLHGISMQLINTRTTLTRCQIISMNSDKRSRVAL